MVIARPRLIVFLYCVLTVNAAAAAPAFWPARAGSDGAVVRMLPRSDCRVHAVTEDGSETLYACGAPTTLSSRVVAIWIEQGDAISGQIAPPVDAKDVDLPLVPAGTVQLDLEPVEEISNQRQRTVRLLHAGAVRFSRTVTVGAAGERFPIPAGNALALELDSRGDVSRLAFARVAAARTTEILPIAPAEGAALVGLFAIPTVVANATEPATFVLDGDRTPEFVIAHGGEVVALWRGLMAGSVELTLRSDAYQFVPAAVRLRPRSVATIRAELRPLPTLTVKIDVPESALAAWKALEPTLSIRRTSDKKIVRQSAVISGDQQFSSLPVDVYDAVLTAKPWTFVRRADLNDGMDDAVAFAPEPLEVSGRVMAGDEPAAAGVVFRRGNGDATEDHSDANGDYKVTLWMRDMYIVETSLDERAGEPPFSRAMRITSSRRLDIRVPGTKVLVQVMDAVSGKPVANAEVTTFNRWDDPASGKGTASHTVATDASGIARLAPLTPGTAEVHVNAAGYFKDDPITVDVREDRVERTVAVKVRPVGATSVVRVMLPTGIPARDAEMVVVADPRGWQTLWSGRSDAQGQVSVPRSLSGSIVLVRHPAAAGFVQRFEDLPEQEYRLPPATPQPLLVKVERRGEAARNAAITIWFGGLPVTGAALDFLVSAPAYTSLDGLWTGTNLPAEPLRILASSGTIDAQIAAGAYDALATVVPEGRPNQIVLSMVD